MQNYTSATVEGHVTHEPVLRMTKTGKAVCTFSVAINHYSNPDSAPRVSYIDIETWEKVADLCSKNISRGKYVIIFGSLKQDRWEGKDGKVQSKIKMVGNQVRFMDHAKDAKETASVSEQSTATQ